MSIYIGWYGNRSKLIASTLANWLTTIIKDLKIWVSESDIEKKPDQLNKLSAKLKKSDFVLFCITPENVDEPWLLFEAGALSRVLSAPQLMLILYDIESSTLKSPLSQFQAIQLQEKKKTYDLFERIILDDSNTSHSTAKLDDLFEEYWPIIEQSFREFPIRWFMTTICGDQNNLKVTSELLNIIGKTLATLPQREETVIRRYFGIGENHAQIIYEMDLSDEQMRQILAKALRKLHHPTRSRKLQSFLNDNVKD